MGLFRKDFYRFFAVGFAAGAAIVLGTLGLSGVNDVAGGVVPSAIAAPVQ